MISICYRIDVFMRTLVFYLPIDHLLLWCPLTFTFTLEFNSLVGFINVILLVQLWKDFTRCTSSSMLLINVPWYNSLGPVGLTACSIWHPRVCHNIIGPRSISCKLLFGRFLNKLHALSLRSSLGNQYPLLTFLLRGSCFLSRLRRVFDASQQL